MTEIKIAAPTNDRLTLAERSGRAKEFAVFTLENAEITNVEYRENHHEHHHEHGHHHGHGEAHGHDDIVQALKDCRAVVGRKFGPHFAGDFHKANIRLVLSQQNNLEEAVKEAYHKIANK